MNLKKIKLIGIIGIFGLCFINHFIYDIFPNDFFAIFFPVNESIWEHMKMLFTTVLIYGFIEYIFLKYYKIQFSNFFLSLYLSSLFSIVIYLSLFLPFSYLFGESEILIFSTLIITIILIQLLGYYVMIKKQYNFQFIPVILIGISYIVFGYLTYHPIKTDLFYDKSHEKYGISYYDM